MDTPRPNVTDLLRAHRQGEEGALNELFGLVYDELRAKARQQKAGLIPGDRHQTTALVHETYLKLVGGHGDLGSDRAHFMALAARAMRMLLVDQIRHRNRQKRGGHQQQTDLQSGLVAVESKDEQVLAVHQALDLLAEVDPRLVQITECRFFAGLTTEDTASAVGVSKRTVIRGWQAAQAFLGRQLASAEEQPSA